MSETGTSTIQVRPTAGGLGAEILGVDLSRPLGEADLTRIRTAHADYGVIFFRDQELTPEAHVAFAESLGEININRFFQSVDGHPMIAEVRKEPEQKFNIGGGWHTDHSYDHVPAMGSVLYAREVPDAGGDTLFASMYRAYEALSPAFQAMLEGLRAVHSSRHVFGEAAQKMVAGAGDDMDGRIGNAAAATQDAVHPVVIKHPLSGRKALYVNPGFTIGIDGWSSSESNALLKFLYRHAVQPEFTTRFRWEPGSIAFWDNRATWHYALNDYHGKRRLMHRITLEGVELEAA